MFTGKAIVINGGVGLGKLLAAMIPQEIAPLQPHLPYSRKQTRRWGQAILACIVFPVLFVFFGAAILQMILGLGAPIMVPVAITFLLVSFGIYKLGQHNIYDILNLTETEMTITSEHVQWIYRRPLSKDEVHTIPLSEYLGLRFEVHEVTRTHPSRYIHEFYYVTLVHSERENSLNLYCGSTTQHIPYVLQEWSKLLPVPVLEPNELAKERVAILASASRNLDKPIFQTQF